MLHCIARSSSSERVLVRRATSYLDSMLRSFTPIERLVLILDGPASTAKLATQRRRRIDHSMRSVRDGLFDCQQFSPGCLFMTRFEEHLCGLFTGSGASRLHIPAVTQVCISGAAVPGEGESKIFAHMRQSALEQAGRSRAIIASDSDILLQAIGHGLPNSHIVAPPWQQRTLHGHFDPELLTQKLVPQQNDTRIPRLELALMVALSANDYLPGLRLANYPSLWSCLAHSSHRIVGNDYRISISALGDFARHYCQRGFPSNLIGLQERILEEARQNPEGSHQRIVSYLASIQTLFGQITGTGAQPADLGHEDPPMAPSIGELAFMEVDRVVADLATRPLRPPPGVPQPGASAILMMDLHDDALLYLPAPLIPTAQQYAQQRESFASEQAAVDWLNLQIAQLPRDTLTPADLKTIFRRDDIVIFPNHPPTLKPRLTVPPSPRLRP